MPRRAVLVSTGGQVLNSGGAPLTTLDLFIVQGAFSGRPAVEVAGEAVAWWGRELAALA
jgi:hypothetical protein